jgi:hypothetical protein
MELYGYHTPSIKSPLRGKMKVQVVEEHMEQQEEVLQLLKDNLAISHNWMKKKSILTS